VTDVYRCLPRKLWSIREAGKVVAHVDAVYMMDVTFHCSEAGVRRIQANARREIVAFARGRLFEGPLLPSSERIVFNPYRSPAFTDEDGWRIHTCHLVHFMPDGTAWGILS